MQLNNMKKIEKIAKEFNKINRLSKLIIKYGFFTFIAMFLLGALTILMYQTVLYSNDYTYYLGTLIVKTSFTILAEAVIGGLVIDFITAKG
ncbi:hypothetical protein [Acetivibrio straminisolvens]|uniref:Uncharacterized protein n=1 Tax=Acetivibrio straminisolvens JCM 21531 TaxID=1294263 RepID=W4V8E2_9FIRM|nr:hypothetical protein [Acetivibrio straminisolvens]GAE89103.1 hypothetical protein JCM21531_2597 [Acetivibrio straminisolvens JCM 21531]